jgi:thiol-disulfide isomerase/thioredoxin
MNRNFREGMRNQAGFPPWADRRNEKQPSRESRKQIDIMMQATHSTKTRAGDASLATWIIPLILVLCFPLFIEAQDPVPPAEGDKPELSEVEYLLELREAERDWDKLMSATVRPESTRFKPVFDPEKLQPMLEASQVLLSKMDAMLSSPRITQIRKDQIRFKKLSFLYDAMKINSDAFKPSRDALLSELYDQARREEGEEQRLAALLAAYKLREDFIDSEKDIDKIQAALDEFRRAYPRSGLVLNLYFRRAENLEEVGDIKGAIEILRRLQSEFPSDPRLTLLNSRIKRLEMIGTPAELVGPSLDGSEFNIADHAGKVVLVDFWASWCKPCLIAFADLKRLQTKYQDKGLIIVGPTLDDNREEVNKVLERIPASWTLLFFEPKEGEGRGFENPLATKFQVNYIPARFLIGKDGKFIGTNYPRIDVLELSITKALGLESIPPDPEIIEDESSEPAAEPAPGADSKSAPNGPDSPASEPTLK